MNLLLRISVLLLALLGQAFAGLEILTEWNVGYQAKFRIHVDQATNSWRLELEFDKNVDSIEVSVSKKYIILSFEFTDLGEMN